MKSGRDLDALVAEKVMGIVWDEKRCRMCGWPIVADDQPGCWASNCSMRPMPSPHADEPARYSTDVTAAWGGVVDHMREQGYDFDFFASSTRLESGRVDAIFRSQTDVFHGRADAPPLAICLAALEAVADAREKV